VCGHSENFKVVCEPFVFIQGVPGFKVTTSGFNSRADSEPKTSYTYGSNSQRFRSYEFLKFLKIRKERGAIGICWVMLLNVQLQIRRSTLKQVVRSVLRLLGYILWLVWPEDLQTYEALQRCWCFLQRWEFAAVFRLSCSPCVHTQ